MLVRYKVENFLSFYKEREFSMITGRTRSHKDHLYEGEKFSLLKGGFIYGANAAGKSNFIKSIYFAKNCILKGIPKVNTIEKNYKLKEDSLKIPSQFEFEILIEDKVYAYGFSLMLETKKVIEEWLCEVQEKSDRLIFSRKEDEKIQTSFNLTETDNIKLNVYLDDLESKNLLLEVLSNKKWENENYEFLNVLKWFKNNLIIIFPDTSEYVTEYFGNDTVNWKKYLKLFDTGIIDISFGDRNFKEIPIPDQIKEKISNDMSKLVSEKNKKSEVVINMKNNFLNLYLEENELKVKEILFKHESSEEEKEFKFYEESDGTKRLLELIPILEKVKCENHTIFVDELERSLHPLVVTAFLDICYENMKNNKSQLVVATHESRLLDLDKIRRDEIWFVDRDLDEGTKLFSLEKFQTRFDTKLDKAYLLGRYGGIPNIAKILDDEIECDN